MGCPQIPNYSAQQWADIEKSVLKLHKKDPLLGVMHDYLTLREKAKACGKYKDGGLASLR